MKRLTHTIVLSLVSATLGCATDDHRHATHLKADGAKVAVATLAPSKAATTQPTMNNVRGTVTFSQVADGVAVIAEVTGLQTGTVYPALRRLERLGFVRSRWESERVARRDQRPARRYYELTAAGSEALEALQKRFEGATRLLAVRPRHA